MKFKAASFSKIASLSAKLPAFRGRTRLFLILFGALGLANEHIFVETRLRKPIPYKARLDLHSWLQRIAYLTGGYEDDTVRFLLRLFKSHSSTGYCLDIGANVGLISIPLALLLAQKNGSRPRIIAVEAVPDNYQALKINISLNGLDGDLLAMCAALGDCCKSAEIQVEGDLNAGEGSGTANFLPDNSDYECVRQKLELQTLDQLQSLGTLHGRCSVIKIDTDGYDLKILQGATEMLKKDRPIIFGEFSAHCMNWHGQRVNDVIDLASANDYLVWQKSPKSWAFARSVNAETYVQDLLLLPAEREYDFLWCLSETSS